MKRFFIDSFSYRGVVSTNDMYKLISTVDNIIGDCYEVPAGTTLKQCESCIGSKDWKLIYSGLDPFCCSDHSEYGFKITSDEFDDEATPCGYIIFEDLKTGEQKHLNYDNTFELKEIE